MMVRFGRIVLSVKVGSEVRGGYLYYTDFSLLSRD